MKKQSPGKKLYSAVEAYRILYQAFRIVPRFVRAQKSGLLREEFTERLMLAVTEVNQCALCSYAHTKMALETGMSRKEIESMLSDDLSHANPEELPAILFAQHYADSRGKPSQEAWDSIRERYGSEKSIAILGAIRMIMLGNAYGIPLGELKTRLSGNADRISKLRSSIWYELMMLVTLIPFLPCALLNALVGAAFHVPLTDFKNA